MRAYRGMAADTSREREALEWCESLILDLPAEDETADSSCGSPARKLGSAARNDKE